MTNMWSRQAVLFCGLLTWLLAPCLGVNAADGVFVRFKLTKPAKGAYYIRLRGYIHRPNWYLPQTVFPKGAAKDPGKRAKAGEYTDWFDVKAWAGKKLHGRMNRSGGVAEFPNVALNFVIDQAGPEREVVIELATARDPKAVVKTFTERFAGNFTSFLVSPSLKRDKDELETFSQMCERHV